MRALNENSVRVWSSAILFHVGMPFLFLKPPTFTAARGPCLLTCFRDVQSLQQHRSQLLQAIDAIAFLIAMALRHDDNAAILRDKAFLLFNNTYLDVGRQRGVGSDVPAHHCLGRDLVDILSTGASAARVGPRELVVGDLQGWSYFKHLRCWVRARRGRWG